MIDYSLGCILANVPVSYDEFKMKFICLEITLRPLHGGYEKNHGLKGNFSVRPLHEAALYTVIYGICKAAFIDQDEKVNFWCFCSFVHLPS